MYKKRVMMLILIAMQSMSGMQQTAPKEPGLLKRAVKAVKEYPGKRKELGRIKREQKEKEKAIKTGALGPGAEMKPIKKPTFLERLRGKQKEVGLPTYAPPTPLPPRQQMIGRQRIKPTVPPRPQVPLKPAVPPKPQTQIPVPPPPPGPQAITPREHTKIARGYLGYQWDAPTLAAARRDLASREYEIMTKEIEGKYEGTKGARNKAFDIMTTRNLQNLIAEQEARMAAEQKK